MHLAFTAAASQSREVGPREGGAGSRKQKQKEAGMREDEGGPELLSARRLGRSQAGAGPPRGEPHPWMCHRTFQCGLCLLSPAQNKLPDRPERRELSFHTQVAAAALPVTRLGDADVTVMCPEDMRRCHCDAVGDMGRGHRDGARGHHEGTRQESPQETEAQRG